MAVSGYSLKTVMEILLTHHRTAKVAAAAVKADLYQVVVFNVLPTFEK